MTPRVSAGEAMKHLRAVKARAERMVAKVLEGAVRVPDELRGTYLDAVWRGVREVQWPGVTAREAELLHDQAVAASLALNLHEIGEKFRAEEAARESAPIVDHPSHRFEGDEPQCECGAYPGEKGPADQECPIHEADALDEGELRHHRKPPAEIPVLCGERDARAVLEGKRFLIPTEPMIPLAEAYAQQDGLVAAMKQNDACARCTAILLADPTRHFRECPKRAEREEPAGGASPALFAMLVNAVRGLVDALQLCDVCQREKRRTPATRYMGEAYCDEHAPRGALDKPFAPNLRSVLVLLDHCPKEGSAPRW